MPTSRDSHHKDYKDAANVSLPIPDLLVKEQPVSGPAANRPGVGRRFLGGAVDHVNEITTSFSPGTVTAANRGNPQLAAARLADPAGRAAAEKPSVAAMHSAHDPSSFHCGRRNVCNRAGTNAKVASSVQPRLISSRLAHAGRAGVARQRQRAEGGAGGQRREHDRPRRRRAQEALARRRASSSRSRC